MNLTSSDWSEHRKYQDLGYKLIRDCKSSENEYRFYTLSLLGEVVMRFSEKTKLTLNEEILKFIELSKAHIRDTRDQKLNDLGI